MTVYRNACVVPPSSLPSCPHCICSFLPSFLFDNCVIDEYRVFFWAILISEGKSYLTCSVLGRSRRPPPASVLVAPLAPSRMSLHEQGSNESTLGNVHHSWTWTLSVFKILLVVYSTPFILHGSKKVPLCDGPMPSVISRPLRKTAPARRPRALRKGLPRRERAPGPAVPRCTVDARTNHARRNGQLRVRRPSVWRRGGRRLLFRREDRPLSPLPRYAVVIAMLMESPAYAPIPHQNAVWPRQVAVTAVPYASLTGIFHVDV